MLRGGVRLRDVESGSVLLFAAKFAEPVFTSPNIALGVSR
jgi:hypothetical protein